MSDNEQDEIITEFLVEAHENLDVLDRELLALEKNPHTPELWRAFSAGYIRSRVLAGSSASPSWRRWRTRQRTCSPRFARRSWS